MQNLHVSDHALLSLHYFTYMHRKATRHFTKVWQKKKKVSTPNMAKFYLCEDSRSFFIPTHIISFSWPGPLPVCCLSCGDSLLIKLCKLISHFWFLSPFSSYESKYRLGWLCWKALQTDLLHKWCWIQTELWNLTVLNLNSCSVPDLQVDWLLSLSWPVCKMGFIMIANS